MAGIREDKRVLVDEGPAVQTTNEQLRGHPERYAQIQVNNHKNN